MYQDFLTDVAERKRYWLIRRESYSQFRSAEPNAGHLALARLEAEGRFQAVVTQNIDELHQRAGSQRVLEVHGTAMQVHCLSCDKRYSADEIQARLDAGDEAPVCDDCEGILKSMTVSFGQDLPQDVWAEAVRLSEGCDLFLAMGSSLVVHPAALLPQVAKQGGARLVIVNRDSTPLDGIADIALHTPIGETMAAVMAAM